MNSRWPKIGHRESHGEEMMMMHRPQVSSNMANSLEYIVSLHCMDFGHSWSIVFKEDYA